MTAPGEHRPLLERRSLVGGAFAMAMAAAGAFASGCSSVDVAAEVGSGDVEEEVALAPLAVHIASPSCIDPYNACTVADLQVVWQLFDPLTRYDFETGELSGLAAESWDVSDDARTFTFHLREGATFHNGEAVSASSFKRAWERVVNPQSSVARLFGASDQAYHLALVEGYEELASGLASGLSGLVCTDDLTLTVSLTQAYADFPFVVAHPALSPVPYVAEADPESFNRAPVGNGPFRLADEFTWDDDVQLVRFEDYGGSLALPDEVLLSVHADADTAFSSFSDGELDVSEVPVSELSSVKKEYGLSDDPCVMDEDGRLVLGSELGMSFLVCNTAVEPLDSVVVRRALSAAIDRDYLSDSVYLNVHHSADSALSPWIHGYRSDVWSHVVHDLERAQQLLSPLYPADEDGMRELSLTLTYYRDGGHDEVVGALVDDLRKAGVSVSENAVSWDALTTRLADGSFELALFSWTPDYPTMDAVFYPLFHSAAQGTTNFSAYADDEVDAALDEARGVVDDDARIERIHEAEEILAEDMPIIPLVVYGHACVCSERVSRLYLSPQGPLDLAAAEFSQS